MTEQDDNYTPRILAFLCNWCSYAGADMAGVSRIQYPPTVRVIRVMCSGRVDPVFVMEGLLNGADGVMILGCHPGDCHYIHGNYEAMKTTDAIRRLLAYTGIHEKRLTLDWVSASEGVRFRELVQGFTRQVKEVGRLGGIEARSAGELRFDLQAARMAAQSEKFRWVMSKQTELMESGNRYGEKFTRHEMDRALELAIIEALAEARALLALAEKPASVKEIAARTRLSPAQALRLVALLGKRGLVKVESIQGRSPLYSLQTESGIRYGKNMADSRRQPGRRPVSAGRS